MALGSVCEKYCPSLLSSFVPRPSMCSVSVHSAAAGLIYSFRVAVVNPAETYINTTDLRCATAELEAESQNAS
eukprot:6135707-Amphidinium_carterae.1